MQSRGLIVFIDAIANYFTSTTGTEAIVGTPFLAKDVTEYIEDYTGIIGISGSKKGSIVFSAPSRMMCRVVQCMGLSSTREEELMDLVGEVCNTVSGNARREFGENFNITVPITIKGKPENFAVSEITNIFIIPIEWSRLRANLIVNLEDS